MICEPLPPPSHTPTRPSTKQGNTNRPLSGHIFLKTAGDGGSRWRSAFVNKSFTRPAEGGRGGWGGKMVNKQTGWGVFMLRPPYFAGRPRSQKTCPPAARLLSRRITGLSAWVRRSIYSDTGPGGGGGVGGREERTNGKGHALDLLQSQEEKKGSDKKKKRMEGGRERGRCISGTDRG